jgi:integrating conjugative element protein (TIGR03765 family)
MHADLSTFADEAWILPVRSSHLSPGQIASRTLNMPGLRPFFLVGDDPVRWFGCVNVRLNCTKWARLASRSKWPMPKPWPGFRAAAPGITILPVNGNDIATRLQIEHYPVLITATSLEQ